jgi:hypothetical protein
MPATDQHMYFPDREELHNLFKKIKLKNPTIGARNKICEILKINQKLVLY